MQVLTPHQNAAIDLSKSISLTANAGSGKTFVLSKRFLEILVKTNTNLNKIAAITFTDKAAGELYKKISIQIELLISSTEDITLRNKLRLIRSRLVSANISTIHSFCLDILKRFPVEANLDSSFVPIDENKSSELIELAVEEIISIFLNDGNRSSKLKELIRLFGSKNKFADELKKLVVNRKNVIELKNNIYNREVDEIAAFFETSFDKIAKQLIHNGENEFLIHLKKLNSLVLNDSPSNIIAQNIESLFINYGKEKEIRSKFQILSNINKQIFTMGGTVRKQGYLSSKLDGGYEKEIIIIENFLKDLGVFSVVENHEEINYNLAKTGKRIIEIFDSANDLYEQKKRENSYIDFEDILMKTKALLQVNDVQTTLSSRYDFLLVDEYQDTNNLQYQIFLPILDDLKSGNLFIVGDEKQSIYRFRDAELEVFERTKNKISDKYSNSLLSLPESFRMAPQLCLFTNILFNNLFGTKNEMYNEVEQSEIICAKNADTIGQVEFLICTNNPDEKESELVAKRILLLHKELVSYGKSWSDIAVLVRKRNSFKILEHTLSKFNIPYSIIGGKGFYQRQSIYDVYNYFSFLLNEEDDNALVGILRSSFFNLSDSKIFEISLQKGNSFYRKLVASAENDGELKEVFYTLNENINFAKMADAAELIRKILQNSSYVSVISSRLNSEQELANLNKLITLTIQFVNDGFRSLYDFVNYLKNAITQLESTPQASTESSSGGVNILTIHQAKGLEYEAVFLFNCSDYSKVTSVKSKEITINKEFGLLTKVPLHQNYFGEYSTAPIISACNLIESKKELAEVKRLLYVGITRAKKYLFVSSMKQKSKYHDYSFLNLIQSGLNTDFDPKEIKLSDNLQFLISKDGSFINERKVVEIKISVVKNLENIVEVKEISNENIGKKIFLLDKIQDETLGEIISAAKFTTYQQCPLKYKLQYELGVDGGILNNFSFNTSFSEINEVDLHEDRVKTNIIEIGDRAIIKGVIIHSALEKSINENQIKDFVKTQMNQLYPEKIYEKKLVEQLAIEIIDTLQLYMNSEEYNYITKFKHYKNEVKLYKLENDYYLYGIVDKIIILEKKILIIDYKTVSENTINNAEHIEKYINQLKFYLYIANSMYADYYEFEGRIIFVKSPDENIIVKLDPDMIDTIKESLSNFIANTRRKIFKQEFSHCKECNYSPDGKNCLPGFSNALN